MFDKVLVGAGVLLGSILVIENMVIGMSGYLFLDPNVNVGIIIFISLSIGAGLGFGFKGIINNKNNNLDDDNDDYNF